MELKIGGIYTSITNDTIIILNENNEKYFIGVIFNCKSNQEVSEKIEFIHLTYSYKISNTLKYTIDGYIGKLQDNILHQLQQKIKKSSFSHAYNSYTIYN